MNILQQPDQFEPAYQPSLLFEVDAEGNEDLLEFRYGFDVEVSKQYPDVFFSVFEGYTFPLENGRAFYTPHRAIQSELSYDFQPFCLSIQNSGNSLVNYRLNLLERWNPDLFFTEITEEFGSELLTNGNFSGGLTGWTATRMVWAAAFGNVPDRAQYVAPSDGPYDGKLGQTVTVDPETDYYAEVNYRIFGIQQPVKIRIQVVYSDNSVEFADTGFFGRDTTSSIGLSFNSREETSLLFQILVLTLQGAQVGAQIFTASVKEASNRAVLLFDEDPGLLEGDIIRINKTDKTINPQYDRFVTVLSADSDSAELDLEIGERSPVPQTGRIISIIRGTGQSDIKKAFNGARQMLEKDVDFSIYQIPLTINEGEPLAKWMHPITSRKISNFSYNTLSFSISDELRDISGGTGISGSPVTPTSWGVLVTSYDEDGAELDEYYIDSFLSFRSNLNRFDVGSGTANWSWFPGGSAGPVLPEGTKSYKTEIVSKTSEFGGYELTLEIDKVDDFDSTYYLQLIDGNTGYTLIDTIDFTPGGYDGTQFYFAVHTLAAAIDASEEPGFPFQFTWGQTTTKITITWVSEAPFIVQAGYQDDLFQSETQSLFRINGESSYWNIDPFELDPVVDVTYDKLTEAFWHTIEEDCGTCCQKVNLCWLNKLGGIDYYTFDLVSSKTVQISRERMDKTLPFDWQISDRGTKDYNIESRERWNLEANFLSDEEANLIRDAVESREVYLLKYPIPVPPLSNPEDFKGYMVPINIVNESFSIQEIDYRDSIDYQITIELPATQIN